jgi:methionyl-tRNA formyltransferase
MDEGIDTGPILLRYKFPDVARCDALSDLRNWLIAFGVEKMIEAVSAIERGAISALPQPDLDSDCRKDNQFFVMHEWLQARAAERLKHCRADVAEMANR